MVKILRICLLSALFVLFCFLSTTAQDKYWVFFTDKHNTSFNPFTYFDAKAIARRIKSGIPLCDSTDFPVNGKYVEQVDAMVEEVRWESRWFNALSVIATPQQIENVRKLCFVKKTEAIQTHSRVSEILYETHLSKLQEKLLENQIARMQGELFFNNNIDGKGIRIAVFDAGFPSVDDNPVFAHLRKNNRIVETYDFARKKENVYKHSSHGTMVLSCIAGIVDGKRMGLATGAEFLLARTEVRAEPKSEEDNWLAAAEWADKHGADIINSSLGYTYHRYFTEDMDGETSRVANAANMAASKGMLVINAMGNDGGQDWKILGTPADADSVLSIGGISHSNDYHAPFSSFGPTADFRMKPNLCAYGYAIVAGEFGLTESQGTSFSCPLVAGFAACAWQINWDFDNMEIFQELEKSGHLYPYYDYAHGYGVPQAGYFIADSATVNHNHNVQERKIEDSQPPTFTFNKKNNKLIINVFEEYLQHENTDDYNYLFYHIENDTGVLDKYGLIEVYQTDAYEIDLNLYDDGILRVYYKGYIKSYEL